MSISPAALTAALSFKAGDEVAVAFDGVSPRPHRVARAHGTEITLASGAVLEINEAGDFDGGTIRHVTDEHRALFARWDLAAACRWARGEAWMAVPLELVEQIATHLGVAR